MTLYLGSRVKFQISCKPFISVLFHTAYPMIRTLTIIVVCILIKLKAAPIEKKNPLTLNWKFGQKKE